MDLRNFEKHINKKFESYQPTTDDSQIWNNIKEHIPSESKDRKLPFFYSFFLTILPLVAFVVFFMNNMIYTQGNIIKSSSFIPQISNNNTAIISNESLEKSLIHKSDETQNQDTNIQKEQTTEAVTQEDKKINTIKSQQNNLNAETKITRVAQAAIKSESKVNAQKDQTDYSYGNERVNSNQTIYSKQQKDFTEEKLNKEVSLVTPSYGVSREAKYFNPFATIGTLDFGLFHIPARKIEMASPFFNQPSVTKKYSPNSRHHLALNGGYYLASTLYTTNQNQELADLRKESEQSYEMIQTMFQYQCDLTKNISLSTGLSFWMHNWQSNHSEVYQETIENSFSSVTRQVKTTRRRINANSGISIPVFAQYNIPISKRINTFFGAGYEFNLKGWHKGYEIDLDQQEYDFGLDTSDRYTSKVGNYFLAEAGIYLPLIKDTKIKFSVSTKLGTDDFQNVNALVRKSYQFYGFNLGIQKNIN